MSNRESQWKAKQLTLKAGEGMLHERQQDAQAREYKASIVEHHSEAYILQTFISKPSKKKVSHHPSGGLRYKQSRNVLMTVIDNILYLVKACFNLCARAIEKSLSSLLPAQAAREIGILATGLAMALLAYAAASQAPTVYSAISHSLHDKSVLAELRSIL